jgi:hypothetical protein
VTAFAAYPPYRPLTAAEQTIGRWGIALARRARRDPFPGITERHAVDQALAATERGQR